MQNSGCLEKGAEGEVDCKGALRKYLGVIKMLVVSIIGMASQYIHMSTLVKMYTFNVCSFL